MEIRKGKIEIELSKEEYTILEKAEDLIYSILTEINQQKCKYCCNNEGYVFSCEDLGTLVDDLSGLKEITEIY